MSKKVEIFLFRAHHWEDVKPVSRAERAAKLLVSRINATERALERLRDYRKEDEKLGDWARVCAMNLAIDTIEDALLAKTDDGET